METLKYIKDMLEVYAKQVNSLEKSGNDEERNSARNEFISNFAKLRDHFPHLLYPLYPADICMEEAEDVVRRIATLVKSNYFPIYPLSAIYIDSIGGDIIESPGIYSFQTKSFRDSTFSIYESNLDEWVMRLLLSLPLGKIELRCVNFDAYGSKSYHGKIGNNLLKTELETIVTERTAKYGNYADYCQAHKQIGSSSL